MAKRKRKQKSGIQKKGPSLLPDQAAGLPTPEFAAKHALETVKTDLGSYALQVRDKRPIDKYFRLYCLDRERGVGEQYRRGISDDQFAAANKLASNYERTMPKVAMQIDAVRVQSSVNVGMYPVESVVDAIHFHSRVMKDLNRQSQEIVESVCCHEANLIAFEQSKGWRKGYGMIRLREGLDELADALKAHHRARRA